MLSLTDTSGWVTDSSQCRPGPNKRRQVLTRAASVGAVPRIGRYTDLFQNLVFQKWGKMPQIGSKIAKKRGRVKSGW